MDGEARDERAPEGEAAEGESAADEETFTEIVDADANGDEERERECWRGFARERTLTQEHDEDRKQSGAGEEREPVVCAGKLPGELEAFCQAQASAPSFSTNPVRTTSVGASTRASTPVLPYARSQPKPL